MDINVLTWIASQLIVAAAIYGGIRTDIRNIHRRIDQTEKSMVEAHTRIDRMLERGH